MSQHPVQPARPVTVRVARWSATHPWRAIALWLVFVTACIALGSAIKVQQANDLDTTVGQAGQAAHWLHESGLESPDTENVLITAPDGRLDLSHARAAARDATDRMRALPQVKRVAAPAVAADRSALAVTVTLRATDSDTDVTPLLDATKAVQAHYPGLRVEEVGSVSLNDAVNNQVNADLSAAAKYSLPVTLVILLIAFGAIVAAGVPLLLALSAVGAATGLSAVASHIIPDSGSTSAMILLMGMAVGVDYSLFYVKRARAERHAGHTQLDAVEIAAETSGHSVLVSGLAVVIAMFGMYLTGDVVFASLATGSILVVAVAVLGSLTVLPAVLVKLGRRIDRPRVPLLWRWTSQDRPARLWPALLGPALRRPGRTLVGGVLLLAALAVPAFGMRLASDSPQSLPDAIGAKHTLQRLTTAFPEQNTTSHVVVRAAATDAAAVGTALRGLERDFAGNPLFLRDDHPLQASADRTVHVLYVDAPFDAESGSARDGVRQLRSTLIPDALRGVPGAQWAVGGDAAGSLDTDQHAADRLPWVIAFVVGLTMLVIGWVFRSVVIAVTTALVNLLSAGAAFGVLVLVFQHHWAEGLLNFHSTGRLINWVPLFCFAVLFGLSMDYHVFMISHIREAARRGLSTRDAVREGITKSAGTVTSAALVMVSVFAIFASLHMVEMKEFGLGLAVAVLIDALVVRIIVLPAAMLLLGRWNWWPGRAPSTVRPAEAPRTLVGAAS